MAKPQKAHYLKTGETNVMDMLNDEHQQLGYRT
jgi:hypothetical protein